MNSVVCLAAPCVDGALTPIDLARLGAAALLAILFLQSGIDKIVDRKGNLEWLTGHFSKTLIEAVEHAGVPRREFLKAVGLLEHRLSDGDQLFTLEEFDDMQRVALDRTGDEALGFRLVEHGSQAAFALVGNLVMFHSCTTILGSTR